MIDIFRYPACGLSVGKLILIVLSSIIVAGPCNINSNSALSEFNTAARISPLICPLAWVPYPQDLSMPPLSMNYVRQTEVIAIVRLRESRGNQGKPQARVSKVFKGPIPFVQLLTWEASFDWTSGSEYLIYARIDRHGEYLVNKHSRTRLLQDAGDDLKFLAVSLECIDPLLRRAGARTRGYQPVCGCDSRTWTEN